MNINTGYKYKTGYCAANAVDINPLQFAWMKKAAMQCERFILGIPDKQIMTALFEKRDDYNPVCIRDFWKEIKWIDDVVILDFESLDYRRAFEKFSFDVCFYGSRYGLGFERDNAFMKAHNVFFIPLIPEKLSLAEGKNAIELPLEQIFLQKKLVLFGTGIYYDFFLERYGHKYRPAYAVDNNKEKWGRNKNGVLVCDPAVLREEKPENILIIVCSKKYQPILEQMKELGDYDYRLLLCRNEIALLEEMNFFEKVNKNERVLKRIHEINYGMLEEFDRVCRLHKVQYFLNYGSCLGAIRHKGFIPWDNDVDVCMTRENYEKLFPWRDDFNKIYRFVSPDELGKKKYYDCVPRLHYKKAYILMDEEACRYYENQNNRIDLDMFMIDKTYDTWKGKFQRFELALLYGLMNAYRHNSLFYDYSGLMKAANYILRLIGRGIPLDWLKKRTDRVAKRFNNDSEAPYYFISNCALCKLKLLFPAEIFDKAIDVPFEDLSVMIPVGYDEFLRLIFGDYMKYPAEAERVPHWGRILISPDRFVFEEAE